VNRPDIFWKSHCSNKKGGLAFFSEEFKNLITYMLQYDPTHRLSLEEIKSHPWYKGAIPSSAEIKAQF
jgi:serine/threonine protein kinase